MTKAIYKEIIWEINMNTEVVNQLSTQRKKKYNWFIWTWTIMYEISVMNCKIFLPMANFFNSFNVARSCQWESYYHVFLWHSNVLTGLVQPSPSVNLLKIACEGCIKQKGCGSQWIFFWKVQFFLSLWWLTQHIFIHLSPVWEKLRSAFSVWNHLDCVDCLWKTFFLS